MDEENPTIKIDEFKNRLAGYVEREYPGLMTREEVFTSIDCSLYYLIKEGIDFLDKIYVNWRGYDAMVYLQFAIAAKKESMDTAFEISIKMFDDISVFFGQELFDAAKACSKNGEYDKWRFTIRTQKWKNGTWPIPGSRPDSGE